MRQQQQQRSRNRNRGRKSSNPLSRNFESNGPDVKIRGNANHIAEKYSVLARDALTSGDTVMAENYFQHAEHYFRIIAATQPNTQNNSNRDNDKSSGNSDDADNGEAVEMPRKARGEGPQPDLNMASAEIVLQEDASATPQGSDEGGDEAAFEETKAKPDTGRNRRNGRKPASSRRTSRSVANKDEEPSPSKQAQDGLSKDAALLPSSLIGTVKENESDKVPPRSED